MVMATIKKEHQKHIFLEALLLATFIFLIGILLGLMLESSREKDISNLYLKSEINILDVQTQTKLLESENFNCEMAIRKNIEFGDRIYQNAKLLEKYEASNKLTDILREQQRRYSMLRILFWVNNIKIKERCDNAPHTIVYLYSYTPKTLTEKNEQRFISEYLFGLKQEYGNSILLIPIAKDLKLNSLDLLTKDYNITDYGVILDEKKVIRDISGLQKIKKILNNSKN